MPRSLLLLLLVLPACASHAPASRSFEGMAPGESVTRERSIQRTARLRLEREDPGKGAEEAVAQTRAHGGYAQSVTGESVTARVPVARLEAFLAEVAKLGEVAEQRVTAEDVTEAHLDLKVRLEALERARQRYLQLLEKAATVAEVVLVEKELQRVTAEHDSLRARLQALESSVALATVHLEFARPVRPGPLGWLFYGLAKGVKWLFIWD